jgi:hypothetical protein
MAEYTYEIGATQVALANVEGLVTGMQAPFSHYVEPYSRYQTAVDGLEYGDGFPRCGWHFDYLSSAMYAALIGYITGQSTSLFIRTRDADGSYAPYSAVMHRPKANEATWEMGGWRNVTFNFTMLVKLNEL